MYNRSNGAFSMTLTDSYPRFNVTLFWRWTSQKRYTGYIVTMEY